MQIEMFKILKHGEYECRDSVSAYSHQAGNTETSTVGAVLGTALCPVATYSLAALEILLIFNTFISHQSINISVRI